MVVFGSPQYWGYCFRVCPWPAGATPLCGRAEELGLLSPPLPFEQWDCTQSALLEGWNPPEGKRGSHQERGWEHSGNEPKACAVGCLPGLSSVNRCWSQPCPQGVPQLHPPLRERASGHPRWLALLLLSLAPPGPGGLGPLLWIMSFANQQQPCGMPGCGLWN